jgi:hypothetical protein
MNPQTPLTFPPMHHSDLYQKYKNERNIELTEAQFHPLIFAFPPLIVVACDGVVDDQERKSMEFIAKSLAFSYDKDGFTYSQIKLLASTYVSEFNYLLDHIDRFEPDFLKALDNYLEENEGDKPGIKEMIITVAEASDGISDVEQQTIDKLTQVLHLDS